jgi:N-dimethylarginine dimethylaminohydrolase
MLLNETVLMSGADYFSDEQAINPMMTQDEPINLAEAMREHGRIRQALETAGVKVMTVAPPIGCQDGVFTANWALVRGDKAVLARLPNARKAEEAYAAEILEQFGKTVVSLPDTIETFSGQGDALPCGELLFCGSGYRSDEAATAYAADRLGYRRISLRTKPLIDEAGKPAVNAVSGLPDSFYYDLDLALAIIKPPVNGQKGLIAWCPAAFTEESRQLLEAFTEVDKIEVDETEALQAMACNLVSTGETVVMNEGAPQLAAQLEHHGLTVVQLSSPELAKGGGSIRCTSLTFN